MAIVFLLNCPHFPQLSEFKVMSTHMADQCSRDVSHDLEVQVRERALLFIHWQLFGTQESRRKHNVGPVNS